VRSMIRRWANKGGDQQLYFQDFCRWVVGGGGRVAPCGAAHNFVILPQTLVAPIACSFHPLRGAPEPELDPL
jgi:hypothetical protein